MDVGQTLDTRYELLEPLGVGATAQVWRALDRDTGFQRAIKVLTAPDSAQLTARFRAEIDTLLLLRHPSIVALHDVGTVDGAPYMVMDLVDGGTLVDLRRAEGALSHVVTVSYTVQVLSALAEAHAHGVVHRDVKLANVLLNRLGRARLCDFGIARVDGRDRLTADGTTLGTVLYMPPEQRLDPHGVGPVSDLYAAAVLAFRLMSDTNAADLFLAGTSSPRWAVIPEALRPVLVRATRPAPKDRYADARAMARALLDTLPAEDRRTILRMPECNPERFAG